MSLEGIQAGQYGQQIRFTVIDLDTDSAADVSGYTTSQQVVFRSQVGTENTKTAAFHTDGSDGLVNYTLASGDLSTVGTWHVRLKLTGSSSVLYTRWLKFVVED